MNSLLKMSPFQIILLVVFAVMAFVGLFLFANYTGIKGGAKQIGTVVIWGTLPQAAVTDELNKISLANKSYNGVSYVQKQTDTFDTDLANAIASQNGPDMILISQEQLVTEESKLNLIPFSNTLPKRNFQDTTYLPEFLLFANANGTYGIPFVLDPMVLYYNKTILTNSGVTTPPTSWEAVVGLAPVLSKFDQAQNIAQSTVAFGTYGNVTNARGILSLLFLQTGNHITGFSSDGILRSALATNASQQTSTGGSPAEAVLNFYSQFSDPSRTVYSWNSTIVSDRQAFLAGNLVFYPGFASEVSSLKAGNPNLNFDMMAIPQPQTSASRSDYGLAYAFAIPKASKNANGAYAAALALTDKSFVPSAAQELSMAPALGALLVSSPTDIYSPVYYPMALIAQGWLSPAPAAVDTIFSAMITNVTSGRLQPAMALSTAAQALDAALGN